MDFSVSSFRTESTPIRPPLWLLVFAIVPPALLVIVAALQPWVPPDQLFRDPLSAADTAAAEGALCCPSYFGLISNLGILLWAGTAAICVLASLVFNTRPQCRYLASFFLCGGLLSGWLALDDLYQIHERTPDPVEVMIFAAYALFVLAYLVAFRRVIAASGSVLIGLSLAFFAVSVVVDSLLAPGSLWQRVGEDGSKFMGIHLWAIFHLRAAWLALSTNGFATGLGGSDRD